MRGPADRLVLDPDDNPVEFVQHRDPQRPPALATHRVVVNPRVVCPADLMSARCVAQGAGGIPPRWMRQGTAAHRIGVDVSGSGLGGPDAVPREHAGHDGHDDESEGEPHRQVRPRAARPPPSRATAPGDERACGATPPRCPGAGWSGRRPERTTALARGPPPVSAVTTSAARASQPMARRMSRRRRSPP